MTIQEASEKHNIPERTLRAAIENKRLAGKRIGRAIWTVTPAGMEKFLENYHPRPGARKLAG